MRIDIGPFHGEAPGINKNRLPAGYAHTAKNCDFKNGSINPIPETGVGTKTVPAGTKSVFYHEPEGCTENGVYISKPELSDFILDSMNGHDVLYISGQYYLKYYDFKTGLTDDLSFSMPLWPSATIAPENINNVSSTLLKTTYTDVFTVSYVVTHVNSMGWESMPSNPTKPINVYTFGTPGISGGFIMAGGYRTDASAWRYTESTGITISNMATGVIKRIYRSQSDGSGGAEFMLVREIDANQTTWTDYSSPTLWPSYNIVLSTEGWSGAPSNLSGIRMISSRSVAGFVKKSKDLYFSEPLVPYAFPYKYKMTMPGVIRQIEVFGEDLAVFMDQQVMVVRGAPGEMYASNMAGSNGSLCSSGKGAVTMPDGIIFPGKDGLYYYNGSYCVNLFKDIIQPSQWMSKRPFKFRAFYHDSKYNAFTGDDTTLHIFDIADKSYHTAEIGHVPVDVHVPNYGLASSESDPMLVPKPPVWLTDGATTVYPWGFDPSGGYKFIEWASGIINLNSIENLSYFILRSDMEASNDFSVAFNYFRSEEGLSDLPGNISWQNITWCKANRPVAIDKLYSRGSCSAFQVIFTGSNKPVHSFSVATSIEELLNG